MLKKVVTAVALVSALGMVSSSAMAQPGSGSSIKPDGVFVGANLGWAKQYYCDALSCTGKSVNDSGFAWNANVGYKFMPYFAAVFDYFGQTSATVNYTNKKGTTVNDSINGMLFALSGKLILPLEDGFSFYGKTGPAWFYANTSVANSSAENKFTWYFGVGAEYNFTENFYMGVGADYSLSAGSNTDSVAPAILAFTGGVGYMF